MAWFSSTLATLGSCFHILAIRAALFITNPTRRTAAVIEAVGEGGVSVVTALDEIRPLVDRGDAWCDSELTNQVCQRVETTFLGRMRHLPVQVMEMGKQIRAEYFYFVPSCEDSRRLKSTKGLAL